MAYATQRPGSSSVFELVKQGLSLVETSGVLPLFEDEASGTGGIPGDGSTALNGALACTAGRRGRPRTRDRLTVRALLALLFVLACRNKKFTWAELVRLIFIELTDQSLGLLGMAGPYWTDEKRRRQIRGPQCDGPEIAFLLPGPWRSEADKEFKRAADHIGDECRKLLACIDTTTMSKNKMHSLVALNASRAADTDLDRRIALCDEVVYRLMIASLRLGNKENYGTVDLTEGIFRDWGGHIGVDETKCIVTTGMHNGATAPAMQLARQTGHARHYQHPDAVGLHSIIALSGNADYTIPAVCLGFGIAGPGSNVTEPVLGGIDLIQRIDPSLLPASRVKKGQKKGAWHRYVVGDRAYPQATNLNAGLLARDYTLIGLPVETQRPYERLAEVGSLSTEGPLLTSHGAVMCPGVNKQRLSQPFAHPGHDATLEQIEHHANQERYLTAFRMGSKWRTPELRNVKAGRPKVGQVPEQQYKLQVVCPAAEGRVRCPLVRRPDSEDRALIERGVPSVEQSDLPKGEFLPSCCPGKTSVVTFEEGGTKKGVKYWQPHIAESTKHWAIYNPGRSRTEAFFSQLKNRNAGDFNTGRTEWKSGSMWSLAVTMSAVRTNLAIIAAFAKKAELPELSAEQVWEEDPSAPAA